jgi:PIN domain nuclease of toxin-antitoxin system
MKHLQVVAAADQPLSPQQKKFNQLVKRIDVARRRLAAWVEHVPLFAQAHHHRVQPLRTELIGLQQQMARRLDEMSAMPGGPKQGGWSKAQRETMSRVICDVTAQFIDDEDTAPEIAAELKALHDRHADVDFDEQARESMAVMKTMLETVSGLDLGDETFESEEELIERAHERMQAHAQQRPDAPEAEPDSGHAGRHRRAEHAARRQQAKHAKQAEEASQSVREVFRKLASALHPDRATDDADRASRTTMMQRVNEAYAKQDLLTLLSLQLEIEQIDAEHLARATSQRAAQYNRVLTEQLQELEAEIEAREFGFCAEYGITTSRRLDPERLGMLLDQEVAALRGALVEAQRDLRLVQHPAGAKRWLDDMRAFHRAEDRMAPFGF